MALPTARYAPIAQGKAQGKRKAKREASESNAHGVAQVRSGARYKALYKVRYINGVLCHQVRGIEDCAVEADQVFLQTRYPSHAPPTGA